MTWTVENSNIEKRFSLSKTWSYTGTRKRRQYVFHEISLNKKESGK